MKSNKKVHQERNLVNGKKVVPPLVKEARSSVPAAKPDKIDWVRRVAGIASGIYGNAEEYIEKERASWDKNKPWP